MSHPVHHLAVVPPSRTHTQRVALPEPVREIVSRFHSKCRDCGLKIGPGTVVLYTPAGRHTPAFITHTPGECGTDYTVQLVYDATRQPYRVRAYTPEHAIEVALTQSRKTAGPFRRVPPVGYVVVGDDGTVLLSRVHELTAEELRGRL